MCIVQYNILIYFYLNFRFLNCTVKFSRHFFKVVFYEFRIYFALYLLYSDLIWAIKSHKKVFKFNFIEFEYQLMSNQHSF